MKVLAEQDVCIGRAVQTLEIMSSDENEVYLAWAREKFLWDQEVRERGAEERKRRRINRSCQETYFQRNGQKSSM